jgi:hypothetical protein
MKLIPARAGPKQKGGTLSVLEERARLPRQEPGSAPLPLGTSRSRALIDNEVPNRSRQAGSEDWRPSNALRGAADEIEDAEFGGLIRRAPA